MSKNLLILGGWGRNEKSYQHLIVSTPPDIKIYFISYEDLIPNGQIDGFNERVLEFLDKNNLDKFYLMGHSLGGALALEFSYHNPGRVEELILIDSAGIYGQETISQALKSFFKSHTLHGKKKALENIKALYRIIRKPLLHYKLAHFAHHIDLQQEAKTIKIPTIILWGEKDYLTPLWQGQKLHELIKGSKLIVLKGMDHDWILHSPELFWQNIV